MTRPLGDVSSELGNWGVLSCKSLESSSNSSSSSSSSASSESSFPKPDQILHILSHCSLCFPSRSSVSPQSLGGPCPRAWAQRQSAVSPPTVGVAVSTRTDPTWTPDWWGHRSQVSIRSCLENKHPLHPEQAGPRSQNRTSLQNSSKLGHDFPKNSLQNPQSQCEKSPTCEHIFKKRLAYSFPALLVGSGRCYCGPVHLPRFGGWSILVHRKRDSFHRSKKDRQIWPLGASDVIFRLPRYKTWRVRVV